jgi:hypothetical protein
VAPPNATGQEGLSSVPGQQVLQDGNRDRTGRHNQCINHGPGERRTRVAGER